MQLNFNFSTALNIDWHHFTSTFLKLHVKATSMCILLEGIFFVDHQQSQIAANNDVWMIDIELHAMWFLFSFFPALQIIYQSSAWPQLFFCEKYEKSVWQKVNFSFIKAEFIKKAPWTHGICNLINAGIDVNTVRILRAQKFHYSRLRRKCSQLNFDGHKHFINCYIPCDAIKVWHVLILIGWWGIWLK